jgi:23S rRNA G2445 N2-methylase RlmL
MADMETAYRLCLWSRLANRVLLVLKRFPMKDAEDLYHGVLDVDWADHMLADGTLAVEFSGHGSGIDNTHFGALKVKDAIVDKLRTRKATVRPSTSSTRTCAFTCAWTVAKPSCPSTCPATACTSAATACSRARRR